MENEKKGTIYAKITKSHPYNTIHGGYFDYSWWIGKILDCKATKEFGDSDTTIETLETAIQYFHYGDQITIVSFEKLVDKVQDFRVFPGKGECLQVSHLYVLDVLELKEKSTVDYIMEHINPEYWKTTGLGCSTYHIRQKGLEEIADYYEACVRKYIVQESDNIIEEEVVKTQEMKSSWIPRKQKLKESVKRIVKRMKNIKGWLLVWVFLEKGSVKTALF